jgi:AAA family ATP:ADP antiporter
MVSKMRSLVRSLFNVEPQERVKLAFLTLAFFFIIGGYTISKELKDAVFAAIVGRTYIPQAKILFMFFMVPAIFLYSKLVDRLRRYHLLCWYSLAYAIIGLLCTYFLGHETIGLVNTQASPYRLFGWIFYFFVESWSPFVVSVLWAFANSINDPRAAKNNYGLMVAGSKFGGMVTAGFAWALLSVADNTSVFMFSDVVKHQILLGVSSLFLLCVPVIVIILMKKVSGRHLHGYEAAYQVEKKRVQKGIEKTGMLSGLGMFWRYPYIFGIFCIVFFFEIINTVLSYQRVCMAEENATCITHVSTYLYKLIFITHTFGFLISLLGTKILLKRLGERICLLLVPISTAMLFVYFFFSTTQFAFLSFFVILRSIHYGFSYPVRESLYIPTVKEIKFKSKSWIDAFGQKLAKSGGSFFNHLTRSLDSAWFMTVESIFFFFIIGCWLVASYLLGKRFEKAVQRNEVIGVEAETD